MIFQRNRIKHFLSRLASEHNLFLGTTSWRFPGWCGTLYDEDLYLWGKHFSQKRFEENCIGEYASVFRSVEIDSTYYAMPKIPVLKSLAEKVPDGFRFSFKVSDSITIKKYPAVSTFGNKAGKVNEYFLDDHLFKFGFLRPLELIREKVGSTLR